ncbi:MAG: DNA polymerase IV, partial [Candidatus Baltobacteraceae bacterium]
MIAHFDVDAFYASVEQRDDPSVRGRPLAIAGSGRRAVVLTASYEARPFGVRSAMPLYRARELCPELIVRPPDFARYRASSQAIFAIFGQGARALEGLSMDEAFADVGTPDAEVAVAFARAVRQRVRAEIGLTVSAGVATQKMLAKIASDDAKPDGLRLVEPGSERSYLAPLDVGRLWGIGPKTRMRLTAVGVTTVGALARLGDEDIFRLLGRSGVDLRELARGNDTRIVEADQQTRSISSEETFDDDLVDGPELLAVLRELSADVARRLTVA